MSTIGMNASMLAFNQLCHQSATAPCLATHAADAVAAHQCHERDNDVIFTSDVKQNKEIAYWQRLIIPVCRYVKIIFKIHKDFPEL